MLLEKVIGVTQNMNIDYYSAFNNPNPKNNFMDEESIHKKFKSEMQFGKKPPEYVNINYVFDRSHPEYLKSMGIFSLEILSKQ